MSWKFGGIYFKQDLTADAGALFDRLGIPSRPSGIQIGFNEVTQNSFAGTAIGTLNGITLLQNNFLPYDAAYEPDEYYELDHDLSALSADMEILCFFVDGVTDSSGMSIYKDGKRIKCRGVFNGEKVLDLGKITEGMEVKNEEMAVIQVIEHFTQRSFYGLFNLPDLKFELYERSDKTII